MLTEHDVREHLVARGINPAGVHGVPDPDRPRVIVHLHQRLQQGEAAQGLLNELHGVTAAELLPLDPTRSIVLVRLARTEQP